MAIWAEIKKAINSNLDKPLNELITEKSAVKSVQRGVINVSTGEVGATATISPVNTSKAVVLYGGCTTKEPQNSTSITTYTRAMVRLASSTSVEAVRTYGVYDVTAPYQVIEYY